MGQLHYDKVDRRVTLKHSRWDHYFWTQYMGQLCYDTVDGTVMLEQNRQDDYI